MLVASVEAGMAGKRSRDTIPLNAALLSGVPTEEVPGGRHAGGKRGGGHGRQEAGHGRQEARQAKRFQVGLSS